MKRWLPFLLIFTLAFVISACNGNENEATEDDNQSVSDEPIENNEEEVTDEETVDIESEENDATEKEITVKLNNIEGEEVAVATLTTVDEGVKVKLTGDGFSEEGKKAFHVHEKGVCEIGDFESAGGHYNPEDKNHGKEDPDGQHAGDFDNIEVDADGKVDVEFVTDHISLDKNAENTVFTEDGTSLVIHDGEDDYKSQPAGDAGDRIACGVIAEPQ